MTGNAVLEHFGLRQNPFGDVRSAKDVLLTKDNQYLPLYLEQTMRNGGMVALVGEVGAGKSTLRRLAMEQMKKDGTRVKVILPRTYDKGRLSPTAICKAILRDIGASEAPKRMLEDQAFQVERLLMESRRAGNQHVLIIEEAHDLSRHTLKYLKRLWEMEDGFEKLLAVMLVGQNELHKMLDLSTNWAARELILRLEVLSVQPLQNAGELREYLELKFQRTGVEAASLFDAGAYDALFAKLASQVGNELVSGAYPLSVNRLVVECMKRAAADGEDKVYADTVREA